MNIDDISSDILRGEGTIEQLNIIPLSVLVVSFLYFQSYKSQERGWEDTMANKTRYVGPLILTMTCRLLLMRNAGREDWLEIQIIYRVAAAAIARVIWV